MYLEQARNRVQEDEVNFNYPDLYGVYFIQEEDDRDALTDALQKRLCKLEKTYGLARQNFKPNQTEETARAFIEAHDSIVAFKLGHNFQCTSFQDFIDKRNEPLRQVQHNLRLNNF